MATVEKKATKKKVALEAPSDVFEVNGKKYVFRIPAYIIPGSGKVLAKDVLKNAQELERLVDVKSGVIKLAE